MQDPIDDYILFIIKPSAYWSRAAIIEELRQHGIVECDMDGRVGALVGRNFNFAQHELDYLYAEHVGKGFYAEHCAYMREGMCYVTLLMWEREQFEPAPMIPHFRTRVLGATDPQCAEIGTLRHRFGGHLPRNGFHASDSVSSLLREVRLFWTGEQLLQQCPALFHSR